MRGISEAPPAPQGPSVSSSSSSTRSGARATPPRVEAAGPGVGAEAAVPARGGAEEPTRRGIGRFWGGFWRVFLGGCLVVAFPLWDESQHGITMGKPILFGGRCVCFISTFLKSTESICSDRRWRPRHRS